MKKKPEGYKPSPDEVRELMLTMFKSPEFFLAVELPHLEQAAAEVRKIFEPTIESVAESIGWTKEAVTQTLKGYLGSGILLDYAFPTPKPDPKKN